VTSTEAAQRRAPLLSAHLRAPDVLQLEGVTKTYPGNPPVEALRSVSLRIRSGELLAIVGPSGSGKSTLLHIMGTLERPTAGRVLLAGEDVARLSDRAVAGLRARRIGFVFQSFFLLEGLSTLENVASGLLYTGTPAGERRKRAAQTLDRVGLGHRLGHRPAQLSGGEKQRVAIARAIVGNPAMVLADEPTGNLDSVSGAGIFSLLRRLNAEGTSVVVITHDLTVAASLPRRVEIRDGRIVADDAGGGS
jgi:putative ABC transport system ATP-binding protein